MHHLHTGEDITITYKRDGRYDDAALDKLNWFLRDWRKGEATKMDPHLIDLVWEVQRETGATAPVQVVCGYRSPATNAMLRHRSSGVARFSQHMLGHAMDFYVPGVPLDKLREIGLRLQRGGVGFYPTSGSPFVHMDTGGIRMWPRMTREQLVRVFPDGRTVHIPTDGKPLPGYALALADVRRRGASPSENSLEAARAAGIDVGPVLASNDRPANPFARLLGVAKDDDDDDEAVLTPAVATSSAPAAPAAAETTPAPNHPVLAAIEHGAQIAEKATVKVAVKAATAASNVKLIRTASATTLPAEPPPPTPPRERANATPAAAAAPAPAPTAAPNANQIITARGYWQGPADGVIAIRPAAAAAARPQLRGAVHNETTGAIAGNGDEASGNASPWADPRNDRVDPALALSYAEQPERASVAAPGSSLPQPAAVAPQPSGAPVALPVPPQMATTVAVKRIANQAASTVLTASARLATVVRNKAHFDNPWLRAVMLSPSVHSFLTTLALGAHDFRTLAALMVKPTTSVAMTFSTDPNGGLANDHFSGAAIVFVSTLNYPARSAALTP